MNMKTLKQYKEEQMQDKLFAKEYEAIQPELDAARAITEANISKKVAEKELDKCTDIKQGDIGKNKMV